jgi:oxygen-dependent protoporphyrinogen oxidase
VREEGQSPQQAETSLKGDTLRVTDALPFLGSFRSGMAALPERLAAELHEEIRYRATISSVEAIQNVNGAAKVAWQIGLSDGERITAQHLILAVPAYVAAQCLANTAPQLASQLKAIAYAPVCAVASVYDRSQVANTLDGFGYMVPRREGLETICTFWNSSLFPGRAPEGKVLMTSFAGRGTSNNGVMMREEECAQIVEAENATALRIGGPSSDRVVWKDPRALPQYNVGHAQRVAEIQNILRTMPNLRIVGNFLKGRSIGDCVNVAFGAAQDVHSQIRSENI